MPKKTARKSIKPSVRRDGWQNILTGWNDVQRDKRTAATVVQKGILPYGYLAALYRDEPIAARVVDLVADDLVREWLDVRIQDRKDEAEELGAELEALGAQAAFRQALAWKRAFGGSAILIGADDGADLKGLAEPLDEASIRSIDFLNVFDSDEVRARDYYRNPIAEKYGLPETYWLNPKGVGSAVGSVLVHESRILRFSGPTPSRLELQARGGWGIGVLERVVEILRDFSSSWGGAAGLIQDFAQAVFKIKGLADAVNADSAATVVERMKLIDMSRSLLRAVLLDADSEDFERKPTPIAGLPELLDRFCNLLSSVTSIPVTRLMGQAPAGLNATGDADIRAYYDGIRSQQGFDVREQAERLVRLMMLAKDGPTKGKEPDVWSVHFRPLWQLDDVQKSTVRLNNANADAVLIDRGVLSPATVAISRFGGDEYGLDIVLDKETLTAAAVTPGSGGAAGDVVARGGVNAPIASAVPVPGAAGDGIVVGGQPGTAPGQLASPSTDGAKAMVPAVDLVAQVAAGAIPREAGIGLLRVFLGLSEEAAAACLGNAGTAGFEPPAPPAAANSDKPQGKVA